MPDCRMALAPSDNVLMNDGLPRTEVPVHLREPALQRIANFG